AVMVLCAVVRRLPLFIPLIAAFRIFGEPASHLSLLAIAIVPSALTAFLWRPGTRHAESPGQGGGLLTVALLLGVWFGYGTIDILFKQMAKMGSAFPTTLLGAFMLAGLVSFAYLFLRRAAWNVRSVAAGLALGLLKIGR